MVLARAAQLALVVSAIGCGRIGFDERSDGAIGGDTAPACSKVVFLQFEGQALTKGPTSDATQNMVSWSTILFTNAPRYHATSPTRDDEILAIVDGITQRLASFPIAVVTTRPTSGSYNMILFGGVAQDVGSPGGGAAQQLDCRDQVVNDVAWIGDGVMPTTQIVNLAIGALGWGVGLTATTDPNDCMCGWGNSCTQGVNACTLSMGSVRDMTATQTCAGGGTTQDEPAAFASSFCP